MTVFILQLPVAAPPPPTASSHRRLPCTPLATAPKEDCLTGAAWARAQAKVVEPFSNGVRDKGRRVWAGFLLRASTPSATTHASRAAHPVVLALSDQGWAVDVASAKQALIPVADGGDVTISGRRFRPADQESGESTKSS